MEDDQQPKEHSDNITSLISSIDEGICPVCKLSLNDCEYFKYIEFEEDGAE